MQSKHRVIVLIMTLLVSLGPIVRAKSVPSPSQPEIKRIVNASCLVRVEVDPAVMILQQVPLKSLVLSSGVAGKVGQEFGGLSLDAMSTLIGIEELDYDKHKNSLLAHIEIGLPNRTSAQAYYMIMQRLNQRHLMRWVVSVRCV